MLKCQQSIRGFSLIEIAVSMLVVGVVSLSAFAFLRGISVNLNAHKEIQSINLGTDLVFKKLREDFQDTFLIRPRCNPGTECPNPSDRQCQIESCGLTNCSSEPNLIACSDIKIRGGFQQLRGLDAEAIRDFNAVPNISSDQASNHDGLRLIHRQSERPIHCRISQNPLMGEESFRVNTLEDPNCSHIQAGEVYAVAQRVETFRDEDQDGEPDEDGDPEDLLTFEFSNLIQITSSPSAIGSHELVLNISHSGGLRMNQPGGLAGALANDRSVLMGPLKFIEWSYNSQTSAIQRREIIPTADGFRIERIQTNLEKVADFHVIPVLRDQTLSAADRFTFDSLNAPLHRIEAAIIRFTTYAKPLLNASPTFAHSANFSFERRF